MIINFRYWLLQCNCWIIEIAQLCFQHGMKWLQWKWQAGPFIFLYSQAGSLILSLSDSSSCERVVRTLIIFITWEMVPLVNWIWKICWAFRWTSMNPSDIVMAHKPLSAVDILTKPFIFWSFEPRIVKKNPTFPWSLFGLDYCSIFYREDAEILWALSQIYAHKTHDKIDLLFRLTH